MAYKSIDALVSAIDTSIRIAIHNVAEQMVEQLRLYITSDFYNLYDPKQYNRTHQLRDDAPSLQMLTDNMAKIFIDTDKLSYKSDSGNYVATLASLGFHGNRSIFRPGYYWEDFIQWCDKNVPSLLKQELQKQGIKTI